MEPPIQQINFVVGITNAVVSKLFPFAGVVTSQAAVITQAGATTVGIVNEQGQTEILPGIEMIGGAKKNQRRLSGHTGLLAMCRAVASVLFAVAALTSSFLAYGSYRDGLLAYRNGDPSAIELFQQAALRGADQDLLFVLQEIRKSAQEHKFHLPKQQVKRLLDVLGPTVADGDGKIQLELASIYGYLGEKKDERVWMQKAADQGHPDAQWHLVGDPSSDAEALRWALRASDSGSPTAQWSVANALLGERVPSYLTPVTPDYGAAAKLLQRLIDNPLLRRGQDQVGWFRAMRHYPQVLSQAQVKLGQLYFEGRGVEQNYRKAVDLMTRAWDFDDDWVKDRAARTLHIIYSKGLGVEPDSAKAAEWLKKIPGPRVRK